MKSFVVHFILLKLFLTSQIKGQDADSSNRYSFLYPKKPIQNFAEMNLPFEQEPDPNDESQVDDTKDIWKVSDFKINRIKTIWNEELNRYIDRINRLKFAISETSEELDEEIRNTNNNQESFVTNDSKYNKVFYKRPNSVEMNSPNNLNEAGYFKMENKYIGADHFDLENSKSNFGDKKIDISPYMDSALKTFPLSFPEIHNDIKYIYNAEHKQIDQTPQEIRIFVFDESKKSDKSKIYPVLDSVDHKLSEVRENTNDHDKKQPRSFASVEKNDLIENQNNNVGGNFKNSAMGKIQKILATYLTDDSNVSNVMNKIKQLEDARSLDAAVRISGLKTGTSQPTEEMLGKNSLMKQIENFFGSSNDGQYLSSPNVDNGGSGNLKQSDQYHFNYNPQKNPTYPVAEPVKFADVYKYYNPAASGQYPIIIQIQNTASTSNDGTKRQKSKETNLIDEKLNKNTAPIISVDSRSFNKLPTVKEPIEDSSNEDDSNESRKIVKSTTKDMITERTAIIEDTSIDVKTITPILAEASTMKSI